MPDLALTLTPANACDCEECASACRFKPGWFKPGQAEVLALGMGLTLQQLFDQHLALDFLLDSSAAEADVWVLSPAITSSPPGREFPFNPIGTCTFFKNGLCQIHSLGKPFECAVADHGKTYPDQAHIDVGLSWRDHQDQLVELLGREPELPLPDLVSLTKMLVGYLQRKMGGPRGSAE